MSFFDEVVSYEKNADRRMCVGQRAASIPFASRSRRPPGREKTDPSQPIPPEQVNHKEIRGRPVSTRNANPSNRKAAQTVRFDPANSHPSQRLSLRPFYSLNDRVDPAEIDRQLRLFKAGGFGGSFLHSRIGCSPNT
jgi:hypothetical protein